MPTITDIDALAKSQGVSIAVLLVVLLALFSVVVHLYRENRRLYARIEELLQGTIDRLLREGARDSRTP